MATQLGSRDTGQGFDQENVSCVLKCLLADTHGQLWGYNILCFTVYMFMSVHLSICILCVCVETFMKQLTSLFLSGML